jgi:hypothetical protein
MGLWNGHATLLFTLLLAVSSSGSFAFNNVNSTNTPDRQLVNTQRIADGARCVDMYCCAALLLLQACRQVQYACFQASAGMKLMLSGLVLSIVYPMSGIAFQRLLHFRDYCTLIGCSCCPEQLSCLGALLCAKCILQYVLPLVDVRTSCCVHGLQCRVHLCPSAAGVNPNKFVVT